MPKSLFWDPRLKKFVEKEEEQKEQKEIGNDESEAACVENVATDEFMNHDYDSHRESEQDPLLTNYDEEMSLDALIESMRNESSSGPFEYCNQDSANGDNANGKYMNSGNAPKKILKLIPKVYPPHRIDAQSARANIRRSYHDQYVLERAWYNLKEKYLSEEIFIPKALLRTNLATSNMDPQLKGVKENEDSLKDLPKDSQEVEPTSVEPTSVEPTSVEPTSVEPTSVEPEGITVYKLSNYSPKILLSDRDAERETQSYIFPMSQDGKPGMFWGAGHNDDFVRPIEAIEIFRLPSWKEEEYSLKLIFGPETYLITTSVSGNAPNFMEEIKPCGVELFTHDLLRIQL